jgi:hypothetical protein
VKGNTVDSPLNIDVSPRLWEIIDQASGDPARMNQLLQQMDRADFPRFYQEFTYAVSELLDKIEELTGEDATDMQESVACWVISQGSDFYTKVFNDPSLFPHEDEIGWDVNFRGAAIATYEKRFGERMPKATDRWPVN